ncbi:hypothetical protein MAR_ORF085 [Marseillevirus marseillevirus]|uniref:RHH-domain DNA-binding protein n=1 Tax=Marseillevirus marseillevirus TaxID=694581 RepID=D2XA93_GBMV|nr:hypothetical protein MAR_ORF085 [Marseillevirus marseillevirus]ADB03870.1 hypothetical protein MAR_ORF085 [Marseillevirus marseillevirus]
MENLLSWVLWAPYQNRRHWEKERRKVIKEETQTQVLIKNNGEKVPEERENALRKARADFCDVVSCLDKKEKLE